MPVADSSDMVVDSSYGAQEGKSPSGGGGTEAPVPVSLSSPAADILKNFYHTKRVGNYLIGRKLGEGSFAKVREGLHALTGEKVRRIHITWVGQLERRQISCGNSHSWLEAHVCAHAYRGAEALSRVCWDFW